VLRIARLNVGRYVVRLCALAVNAVHGTFGTTCPQRTRLVQADRSEEASGSYCPSVCMFLGKTYSRNPSTSLRTCLSNRGITTLDAFQDARLSLFAMHWLHCVCFQVA
jgi:hypothetical protein